MMIQIIVEELLCRAYCDTEKRDEFNYADFCTALRAAQARA